MRWQVDDHIHMNACTRTHTHTEDGYKQNVEYGNHINKPHLRSIFARPNFHKKEKRYIPKIKNPLMLINDLNSLTS